jgi:hypothetical protein
MAGSEVSRAAIEQEEGCLVFDESVQEKAGQTRTKLFAGMMTLAKGRRSRVLAFECAILQ